MKAKRFDCHNKLQYISYVMHIIAYAEFISPEILWYLANSKNEFSHHKHSVRKKEKLERKDSRYGMSIYGDDNGYA